MVGLGFAGVADDEIGAERDIGARPAQTLDDAPVIVGSVTPAHRRQNTVAAGLDRQMQKGH